MSEKAIEYYCECLMRFILMPLLLFVAVPAFLGISGFLAVNFVWRVAL